MELRDDSIYCPICQRVIFASNAEEVEEGDHESYVFVHDDVIHNESDMVALEKGLH